MSILIVNVSEEMLVLVAASVAFAVIAWVPAANVVVMIE